MFLNELRGSSYSMVGTNHMDEPQLEDVFGRVRGSDMVAV
jgi:hypothetical protein